MVFFSLWLISVAEKHTVSCKKDIAMKHLRIISITLALFMLLPISTALAQSSDDPGAELSVIPVGQLPAIIPNEENIIKLQYVYCSFFPIP